MPLGDSITFGTGDPCGTNATTCRSPLNPKDYYFPPCAGSYRKFLWRLLHSSTVFPNGFEFVGSQLNGPEDIDRHHEGHPGWTVENIEGIRKTWTAFVPDIILLHLGTNDMGFGDKAIAVPHVPLSGIQSAVYMDHLLNLTFTALPHTHVMLASIIGSGSWYGGSQHKSYNEKLLELSTSYAAKGFSITFVDMEQESGIGESCDPVNCCFDRIHPSIAGYERMAKVWFNHLSSVFGSLRTRQPPVPHSAEFVV